MNGQIYGNPFNIAPLVEEPVKEPDTSVKNLEPFSNQTPADGTQVDETPVDETPRGGTIAPVGKMDDVIIPDAELGQDVSYKTGMADTLPYSVPTGQAVPYKAPIAQAVPYQTPVSAATSEPLLTRDEAEHFRTRWSEIQGKFVDDPRVAVQEADTLVTEVIDQISQMFDVEHTALEGQWNQGSNVSTEDLRNALKRYRSFFNRLVV